MERLKKLLLVFALGIFFAGMSAPTVSAQGILPGGPKKGDQIITSCDDLKPELFKTEEAFKTTLNQYQDQGSKQEYLDIILGCAVKTGRIHLFMVPFFITYLIQFLLGIAGLVAVLFVVIGGYHYVIGGITEEKEKGKKTILHALMGLIVALSAWMIINFIQVALTS